MDLTEAEDIKKRWQGYMEELYKKDLHDPDNHGNVITNLEPDILECEVKWVLESITTNKASGGDGILVELFQILKDDAVKVLHSICQQIWKTQQWPQDYKRSVFILIPYSRWVFPIQVFQNTNSWLVDFYVFLLSIVSGLSFLFTCILLLNLSLVCFLFSAS